MNSVLVNLLTNSSPIRTKQTPIYENAARA